jgi:hypothetical protein
LIRKLKASGMTYIQIAHIARCSTAAVGAEMRVLKKEGHLNKVVPKIEVRPILEPSISTEFEVVRF